VFPAPKGLLAKSDLSQVADAVTGIRGTVQGLTAAALHYIPANTLACTDSSGLPEASAAGACFEGLTHLDKIALESPGTAEANSNEMGLLLAKTKLQVQQIKHLRMLGDVSSKESLTPLVTQSNSLHSPGTDNSSRTIDSRASETALHCAEQLKLMQQTLSHERSSFQCHTDARQLLELKSLLQSSYEQQCRLAAENLAYAQLVEQLRSQIEVSSNAHAHLHAQTLGLVAGMESSFENRTQQLQAQVAAAAAFDEKRHAPAIMSVSELKSLRSLLAVAADHALVAMRAMVQGAEMSCEGVQRNLLERSCGWYMKNASGEQEGPMNMQDLRRRLPHPTARCWCEGFARWLPYEEAIAVMQSASFGVKNANSIFDLGLFHIAQAHFIHMSCCSSIDRAICCDDENPTPAAAAANTSAPCAPQLNPRDVLEGMWAVVLQQPRTHCPELAAQDALLFY
jgi:hypothetical protein